MLRCTGAFSNEGEDFAYSNVRHLTGLLKRGQESRLLSSEAHRQAQGPCTCTRRTYLLCSLPRVIWKKPLHFAGEQGRTLITAF